MEDIAIYKARKKWNLDKDQEILVRGSTPTFFFTFTPYNFYYKMWSYFMGLSTGFIESADKYQHKKSEYYSKNKRGHMRHR